MGLSSLGIFHTIIGVGAIIAALVDFIKYGKINLNKLSGKIYFYGTMITSLTSLGISKHGGFNPGHVFSIFIIFLVLGAYFLNAKRKNRARARYFENFWLSFSFFLSLVPTVNETFTRIPVRQPLAKDITDPIIGRTLLFLLLLFVIGSVYQFFRQRLINILFHNRNRILFLILSIRFLYSRGRISKLLFEC
ncbi:hypothetical protein [Flavobacterium johnsoniae]|uniref:hypothetical protein n=1 Tax=Flavobacterium johnsoniae TaxID=986 RepID=UPI003D96112C